MSSHRTPDHHGRPLRDRLRVNRRHLLLRPLRPVFQSGIDNAPDGPLTGWAWWCARMLCSFHFFDAVRKGDTRRPARPA